MHYDSTGWMKLMAASALALGLSLEMFGCRGWDDEEPPPWLDDAGIPAAGASGDGAPRAGAGAAAAGAGAAAAGASGAGEAGSVGTAGSSAGGAVAPEFRATPDR